MSKRTQEQYDELPPLPPAEDAAPDPVAAGVAFENLLSRSKDPERRRAAQQAIEALGRAKRASPLHSDRKQITIPVTRRQHDALSNMARKAGVTMREILIVALGPFMGDP